MGSFSDFWSHMDWNGLLAALSTAVAALICLTVHELCHGAVAYRLGDPTAKSAGRLTLNPVRHIDPLGLILMITAHVGWAKPVPVDPRYFKKPKSGMALTALAGPASNFILAWVFLVLGGLLLRMMNIAIDWPTGVVRVIWAVVQFLVNAAVLSVGLGVFNLFPIPPLDGSKVLFALLPDRAYNAILRYERFGMLALLAVVWLGWLDRPLTFLITGVVRLLASISGFPIPLF